MSLDQDKQYIGRFAPSPTGSLHMGSLVAAMASYCEAMQNKGKWLLRIEDIDPPREIEGASNKIISTLKSLGFDFNNKILFQSQENRQLAYQKAIDFLRTNHHTYNCSCSRKELKNTKNETHKCRSSNQISNKPYSVKLKVPNKSITFIDKLQGKYKRNLITQCGDFTLKRKDGLFSYQIAVVVDDSLQGITDIVRGIDLIESTPWQIYLNSLLNFNQPNYAHIPILINTEGQKLSKQTYAKEIGIQRPLATLTNAYQQLNQLSFTSKPPTIAAFWHQAITNWNINKISKTSAIKV